MSKSERILSLNQIACACSCDRIAQFHKKIFITRVINIQILTTKYFSFQYKLSVTYCSQALRREAHRTRETVHLLTHETPDFIISSSVASQQSVTVGPARIFCRSFRVERSNFDRSFSGT